MWTKTFVNLRRIRLNAAIWVRNHLAAVNRTG